MPSFPLPSLALLPAAGRRVRSAPGGTWRRAVERVLAALLVPGAVWAQGAGTPAGAGGRAVQVGIGGGVVVPRRGASASTIRAGTHAQGFVLLRLPGGLPALRANVDLGRMRVETAVPTPDSRPGPPTTAEVTRTLLAGVASFQLDLLRGPVRPYVLAGVGGFRVADGEAAGVEASPRRQVDFGIEGGAGVALRLGPLEGFAETRVQNVYTRRGGLVDTRAIAAFPVTFGVRL